MMGGEKPWYHSFFRACNLDVHSLRHFFLRACDSWKIGSVQADTLEGGKSATLYYCH